MTCARYDGPYHDVVTVVVAILAGLLLGVVLAGLLIVFLRGVPVPEAAKPAAPTGDSKPGGRLPVVYWFYWLTIIAFASWSLHLLTPTVFWPIPSLVR